MEQMCEWGLEKGAGRTEEEVTAHLHPPIEQENLQVESWVRRRKVRIGEDVTCPVCLEELVEGEEVGSNWNNFRKLIFNPGWYGGLSLSASSPHTLSHQMAERPRHLSLL